jgi:diamine N-acetyltransferase
MGIAIRKATMDDYIGLCSIYSELDEFHRECHPELFVKPKIIGRAQEYISELINNDNTLLLVAKKDHEIVGLLEICITESSDFPVNKRRRWIQIDSLAVKSGAQNCNIGSLLLDKAKEWAKANNIDRIELKVYSLNLNAIQFYTRKGFSELSKSMFLDL